MKEGALEGYQTLFDAGIEFVPLLDSINPTGLYPYGNTINAIVHGVGEDDDVTLIMEDDTDICIEVIFLSYSNIQCEVDPELVIPASTELRVKD